MGSAVRVQMPWVSQDVATTSSWIHNGDDVYVPGDNQVGGGKILCTSGVLQDLAALLQTTRIGREMSKKPRVRAGLTFRLTTLRLLLKSNRSDRVGWSVCRGGTAATRD
jgi:hypothetical protein